MIKHIRTKLLLCVIPVILMILILSYLQSANMTGTAFQKEIDQRILAEENDKISDISSFVNEIKLISGSVSTLVSNTYQSYDRNELEKLLESEVKKYPAVLGMGIWFEPYAYQKETKYFGPYVYWASDTLMTTYAYSGQEYDYLNQEYYTQVKKSGKPEFTDVYFDQTSGNYMLTCAYPLYTKDQIFLGCVTADVRLVTLQQMVLDYNKNHQDQCYIVNEKGTFLAAEQETYVKEKMKLSDLDYLKVGNLDEVLLANQKGSVELNKGHTGYRIYYDTLPQLGWKIIFEVPDTAITEAKYGLALEFLKIGLISLAAILLILLVFSGRLIQKPVKMLLEEFLKIGDHVYSEHVDSRLENRSDEFGSLGKSLRKMKAKLLSYQKELENSRDEIQIYSEEIQQQNNELMENSEIMQQTTSYLSSVMEAMPDMMFVISREGYLLDCRGSVDLWQKMGNEWKGRPLQVIFPGDVSGQILQKMELVFATSQIQILEFELNQTWMTGYFELRLAVCMSDRVIGIARNITDAHQKMKEIAFLNYHDQITGLYNRRFFDDFIAKWETDRSYPLSIVFSDLNGLKLVNDSFGHEQGDLLLQKYAYVLAATIDETDLACRIGGDEFVLLLSGRTAEETDRLIDLIQEKCANQEVSGITLSVSFGSETVEKDSQSVFGAVRSAEDQMYQNKLFDAHSRQNRTIDVIVQTLHEKNPREEMHSQRVSDLCEEMALLMEMSKSARHRLKSAALLHDIGKIGVPEDLLNKGGALTAEEYAIICKHPEIGYRILQSANHTSDISEIILYHHERWDGNGYPKGIRGNEIPLESRIITIADAFDAMTSERSYRSAMPEESAVRELIKNAGSQFDPDLVKVFLMSRENARGKTCANEEKTL